MFIGGGDWADDRLIPDMLNAFFKRKGLLKFVVRMLSVLGSMFLNHYLVTLQLLNTSINMDLTLQKAGILGHEKKMQNQCSGLLKSWLNNGVIMQVGI